jgi:hypothetical protein
MAKDVQPNAERAQLRSSGLDSRLTIACDTLDLETFTIVLLNVFKESLTCSLRYGAGHLHWIQVRVESPLLDPC